MERGKREKVLDFLKNLMYVERYLAVSFVKKF